MIKILILYYSGVGNTKCVANKLHSILTKKHSVEIYSIENLPADFEIRYYSDLIIGFPTIHSAPAQPMLKFINELTCLKEKIPTFLFTTCGLYSANTLRIFANNCILLNITPVLCRSYRCRATDGILLLPFMKCWFKHERNLDTKIKKDALCFIEQISNPIKVTVPRIKFYSFINYPNKWLGQKFVFSIYLHKNQCIRCGNCINNCPVKAYQKDDENFPVLQKSKCINCYRCIHHCPKSALSLSKKHPPKKTLYNIYSRQV